MQIAPTHPQIDTYYSALSQYAGLGVTYEQGIRSAFRSLLETFGKPVGWTLVEEYAVLFASGAKRTARDFFHTLPDADAV